MHFYQKNIPDFNNATRHLTRVERSLFSDAIELYYDTEKPLTSDINKLNRLLLAHSQEEKDALLAVLAEFFTLTDEGYLNKRCNEEILKYQAYMESKSKAGKASAEQRAKHKSTGVQQAFNTTSTNYEPLPINQEPLTNNQEPPKSHVLVTSDEVSNTVSAEKSAPTKKGKSLDKDWHLPKSWGEWALFERPELTTEQVRKIAENFKDHWLANANQAKSKKADWEATWRVWVRNQKVATGGIYKNNVTSIAEQNKLSTELARQKLFGTQSTEKDITDEAIAL